MNNSLKLEKGRRESHSGAAASGCSLPFRGITGDGEGRPEDDEPDPIKRREREERGRRHERYTTSVDVLTRQQQKEREESKGKRERGEWEEGGYPHSIRLSVLPSTSYIKSYLSLLHKGNEMEKRRELR